MLTFDQKLAIIAEFPELVRKDVSLGRVNFHFEGSRYDKKTVVYHLHPGGNGFVYAARIAGQSTDDKGFVNIREYPEAELRSLLRQAIDSLADGPDAPQSSDATDPSSSSASSADGLPTSWRNAEGHLLQLSYTDDLWYVYDGPNLEMAFETEDEARAYLEEEGFSPA
ncbi:hypothetical protein PA598K_06049 [Paenibacillus sp. 598K]|uniref:hypothetical protein n=1 Tax=Paenibacillus sp. 598K TaxID=1117987 RepID=UPI000FF963AA|nr:hypothetical protein [Paenibacillus sp. 598K]GBF77495.1 hypothetical protein PA598K_06049 [Paenibacillus sp. 598K]